MRNRFEKQFYAIPTLELAEKLPGKIFLPMLPGNLLQRGKAVETENFQEAMNSPGEIHS